MSLLFCASLVIKISDSKASVEKVFFLCHFLFFLKPVDIIKAALHYSFKMLVVQSHSD